MGFSHCFQIYSTVVVFTIVTHASASLTARSLAILSNTYHAHEIWTPASSVRLVVGGGA